MNKIILCIILTLLLVSCKTGGELALENSGQIVHFPGAKAEGYPYADNVTAALRMPKGITGKVPAVVILHSSGGVNGTGAFYAEELNKKGIATLQVYMFDRGERPKTGTRTNYTEAYGALRYLAQRPDINANEIGVMGFSWGGVIALATASKVPTEAFMKSSGDLRFAAHAAFYPVCYSQLRKVRGESPWGNDFYKAVTGAPVIIFNGGRDDFDSSPQECANFIAALPESVRRHVTLQFYPNATHGWDAPYSAPRTTSDRFAHAGKGGSVYYEPNPEIAKDSRSKVVDFFVRTLKTVG